MRGEIAIEPLVTGRAERSVQRATGLRGNTQRAATGLGYEHRLDCLTRSDVDEPFVRAVTRLLACDNRRQLEAGDGCKVIRLGCVLQAHQQAEYQNTEHHRFQNRTADYGPDAPSGVLSLIK